MTPLATNEIDDSRSLGNDHQAEREQRGQPAGAEAEQDESQELHQPSCTGGADTGSGVTKVTTPSTMRLM